MSLRFTSLRFTAVVLWLSFAMSATADDAVDFSRDVAPIFAEHCVGCHSDGISKGDVSLATSIDLNENDWVVAGEPDDSYLIDLVTAADGDRPEMPQEGDPLTDAQVELLRKWIAAGANWPESIVVRERSKADSSWWSLQPLETFANDASIDQLIETRLGEQQLRMNEPADRRTLIRRATYDLVGLPPTPAEVEAFVNDPAEDAYEKLVDRLLDSPHYGERWGRHWLDVVRFGESNGFERNVLIDNLWPFRDYVIESINNDKPFNQLIREHLAGDVVEDTNPDIAVATAFLVAGPYDNVGNQDPVQAAQIRANTLDEIIGATSQAFLGMTIGCARCHDHKFDPITQQDYYSWYSTFSGIRHGAVPLATESARSARNEKLAPLNSRKAEIEAAQRGINEAILERAKARLPEYQSAWTREPVSRTGTEDRFEPVEAKFVRLVSEAQDRNPETPRGFRIDEFEIWTAEQEPRNVALAENGAKATGAARQIEDFPGAYGPQLTIDGKLGARFIATGTDLTIELKESSRIDRVFFSSARGEKTPQQPKFVFVAEYRIEVSSDGKEWKQIASGRDRRPVGMRDNENGEPIISPALRRRLLPLETRDEERTQLARLRQELADVKRQIAAVPGLPSVWIGTRSAGDAKGPFHVFLGGSSQRKGDVVRAASLSAFADALPGYQLPSEESEGGRRIALANWITNDANPITPRVLANRLWHYHFGTGIVDTPSDFGYMGGRPTHPKLLDFLAQKLIAFDWRLKDMHRMIMTSRTYRQSSAFRDEAAKVDADARLLWRFPPRRLAAEEVRDSILRVAGKLNIDHQAKTSVPDGGKGFRLYRYLQDNVSTYEPLDVHGPDTYRRAVYHQNARASVIDLMTDFDQPDCAFTAPKRAETTTPLQALTLLNHRFTLDMSRAMAERLQAIAGDDIEPTVRAAYQSLYARAPDQNELDSCRALVKKHGVHSLCRALLNTSEFLFVR